MRTLFRFYILHFSFYVYFTNNILNNFKICKFYVINIHGIFNVECTFRYFDLLFKKKSDLYFSIFVEENLRISIGDPTLVYAYT